MEKSEYSEGGSKPPTYGNDGLEKLLAEYAACNEGYNSRDLIVFTEFSVLVAIFSGLIAAMTYVSDKLPRELLSVTIFILGILGILSILGISVDMQSTHSSKVAIRDRMIQIESDISKNGGLSGKKVEVLILWRKTIKYRDEYKYLLEKMFKSGDREGREKEIDLLNISTYLLILLWIWIVVAFLLKFGNVMFFILFACILYILCLYCINNISTPTIWSYVNKLIK